MSYCILIKRLDPHVISPLYRHIMSPYNISINRLHVPLFFGWLPAGSPPVNEDIRQHATAKAAQFAPTQHAVPQPWRMTASWQLKGLSKCHHVVLGFGGMEKQCLSKYIYVYIYVWWYVHMHTTTPIHTYMHTYAYIYTLCLYTYTTPMHI